ncbi:hypothetical protein BDV32DRAFT_130948 [Aspergillus pseudonomiae]|nr:hypothetical protein BDV32DRAFT_130948 [Aspergillus pseudonomiae]
MIFSQRVNRRSTYFCQRITVSEITTTQVNRRSRTLTGHWHWPAGHWQEAPQLQP